MLYYNTSGFYLIFAVSTARWVGASAAVPVGNLEHEHTHTLNTKLSHFEHKEAQREELL